MALIYWVVLLALPAHAAPWSMPVRIGAWSLGGLLVIGSAVLLTRWFADNARTTAMVSGLIMLVMGALLVLVGFVTSQPLVLTDPRRFAIGVGGLAVVGLVAGVVVFDSIRAAASVPVVVLVIGVSTWPAADSVVSPDVKKQIIAWMGVLLAVNGAAESAKQIGEARAKAAVAGTGASVEVPGDLTVSPVPAAPLPPARSGPPLPPDPPPARPLV